MRKQICFMVCAISLLFLSDCSSPLDPEEEHSLSEIRKSARNGQVVKSIGMLAERNANREFVVQDDETSMEIDLAKFKKESKYLKKNTKIIFSGTYRKKPFCAPRIEVVSLQVVEDFR